MKYVRKRDGRLEPFDQERITNAIRKATRAVGERDEELVKRLSNQVVEELRRQTEKIFDDYDAYTNGNIGIAIFTWISRISKYEEGIIRINSPGKTDASALTFFSDETDKLLYQFLVHRRLNIKKALRVLKNEEKNIVDNFAFLQHSGIITETVKDVYEINPYLYIYLNKYLKNKALL